MILFLKLPPKLGLLQHPPPVGQCWNSFWNINGLGLGNYQWTRKLNTIVQDSSSFLGKNDLICFCKTWLDKSDPEKIDTDDVFLEFHNIGARNSNGGRSSGVISLFIRKTSDKFINVVSIDSYHCWCRLEKDFLNFYLIYTSVFYNYSYLVKCWTTFDFEKLIWHAVPVKTSENRFSNQESSTAYQELVIT